MVVVHCEGQHARLPGKSTGGAVMEQYGVGAEDYLLRAKQRLQENRQESLFYAAFELRCFVESRQDDYLDAQREYAKSIPKAYKIGAQGAALEAIFESTRMQHLRWLYPDGGGFEGYHVPVTAALRNGAEKLGDLLHCQTKWRSPEHVWWKTTRDQLVELYRLAWICAQGRLPSPAFLVKGSIVGSVRWRYRNPEEAEAMKQAMRLNVSGMLHVDYPIAPPPEWVPDL